MSANVTVLIEESVGKLQDLSNRTLGSEANAAKASDVAGSLGEARESLGTLEQNLESLESRCEALGSELEGGFQGSVAAVRELVNQGGALQRDVEAGAEKTQQEIEALRTLLQRGESEAKAHQASIEAQVRQLEENLQTMQGAVGEQLGAATAKVGELHAKGVQARDRLQKELDQLVAGFEGFSGVLDEKVAAVEESMKQLSEDGSRLATQLEESIAKLSEEADNRLETAFVNETLREILKVASELLEALASLASVLDAPTKELLQKLNEILEPVQEIAQLVRKITSVMQSVRSLV